MSLNKSKILIRDYENIRGLLRDVYIYGCFNKYDYTANRGISERKYDKEQQRISDYLPEKFIKKRSVNRKTVLYCSYDEMDAPNNFLADTYLNKSFTTLDLMSFIYTQQILNDREELSMAELLELMPDKGAVIVTKDNLHIKLAELEEKGFIVANRKGRNVRYSLAKDIWEEFEDEELLDIYYYLDFVKNVMPLEMPYRLLRQRLKLYLECNRLLDMSEEAKIVKFKHNHLFNVLDNDILLTLMKAIKAKKIVAIDSEVIAAEKILVVPVELIYDSTYGRQYLYCVNTSNNKDLVLRIDGIKSAEPVRDLNEKELSLAEKAAHYSDSCWCTSKASDTPCEVVVEFRFDEKTEGYVLRRVKKEGHGGKLIKKADGVYEYRIFVLDPIEMLPWVRSFGAKAKLVSAENSEVVAKMSDDLRKAVAKYESVR